MEASEGVQGYQEVLWLLGSLSSLYRLPFDAKLVAQDFPPPHSRATFHEAARALGFKTGHRALPDDWQTLPLPAIAFLRAGHGSASVANDTFKVDFGKAHCAHGNEGLGNGEDPPPPGHAENQNDGAGSGPGSPGHHGQDQNNHDDAKDPKHEKHDDWFEDWGKSKTCDGNFAYLDLTHAGLRDRETGPNRGHHSGIGEDDFYHRWPKWIKRWPN